MELLQNHQGNFIVAITFSIAFSSSSNWDSVPPEVAMLASKYSYSIGEERSVQKEVIELKKLIRANLSKQMRIKAGYVQMQVIINFFSC